MNVSSGFVRLGLRHVHYRRAGAGPAVLLLHQSPQSSAAMLPWFERLAGRCTVIAPDTPGFGHSDPLPRRQPTILDFAAALEEFCAALGLERVALYGVHTGAVIALTFALEHPERVALLLCDGYARFDAAEKQSLLSRYLPPFEPDWDGGHLLWLWARLREQHLYFPWHDDRAACRLDYPLPTPERLARDAEDLLAAGDAYRLGYRAPFLHDDPSAVARLTVPAVLLYRDEDVLASHRMRLPALPPGVSSEAVAGPEALAQRVVALIEARLGGLPPAPHREPPDDRRPWTRRSVATRHGPLALSAQRVGDLGVVVLPAPCRAPYLAPPGFLTDRRRGIATVELPGHGASNPWPAERMTPADIADALSDALDALDAQAVELIAEGASAAIALALAQRHPARVARLRLREPWLLEPAERETLLSALPALTPDASGAHLIAAWNWVRLGHLFAPWLEPTAAAVRRIDAPSPWLLHAHTVEVLRLGDRLRPLWRGLLADGLAQAIADTTQPLLLEGGADPLLAARLARVAADAGCMSDPIAAGRYRRDGHAHRVLVT